MIFRSVRDFSLVLEHSILDWAPLSWYRTGNGIGIIFQSGKVLCWPDAGQSGIWKNYTNKIFYLKWL